MKTTINLPESLLRKAKVEAAMRGTTLKDLVVRGLQMAINAPVASQEDMRKARTAQILKALEGKATTSIKPLSREEIYE